MFVDVLCLHVRLMQGAIMAVGASQPTVVATKDGRIGMKNQMQVTNQIHFFQLQV